MEWGRGDSGRTTCRGKSVVDWLAGKEGMMGKCGTVVVEEGWLEEGGRQDGDHKFVRLDVEEGGWGVGDGIGSEAGGGR